MRISPTILDIISSLRTAIEMDDTSHTTSMAQELSRLPDFEGSKATAGYRVSPEGDIKDDHWWLIMDDGSVFDADDEEPMRCSKKDSRHGRYFPYTGETGIPAAVLQAADHVRAKSRTTKNKSFTDMVGESLITEIHDYDPEWDYEVDEQGHDEEEIMQYVNKAIEDVKREVLPVLGFQDMKVFFTPQGGLGGDVGKYISGTSSYPVVGLDLRHTMDGVNFNEHAFFQQVRASLAHELAHAYQESRYGEDALYHDDLEDDAEAFAYNWVMNGKLDPSVLEMQFDEASGASAPSAAARQAPEALPDAMNADGKEGIVVDEFDDETKPEDLQMGWEDLVGEDEGDTTIDDYSCGKCMWLALALNQKYGWDIRAQIHHDDEHGDYVAHAYNVLPNGKEVDVLGVQDQVDIFSSDETRDMTADEMYDFLGVEPNAPEVKKHLQAAAGIIDIHMNLKEVDHPGYMPGGEGSGTDSYDPTYDERSANTNTGWPRP